MPGSDTVVLCYHAVSETFPADLSIRPSVLRDHLHLLHRRGYRGITFSEAVERPAGGRRVAVTFDDAFASAADLGKPILDELGWPATIYAVSSFAADGGPLSWEGVDHWADTPHAPEMASLDWDRLRALADAGWEVGSHTVTHPHLTRIGDADLERELRASKQALEDALGRPCPSIAYPYGDVDRRVIEATRAAGYRNAAGLPDIRPKVRDPFDWPRIGAYHGDHLWRFRLKVSPRVRAIRRSLGR